MTHSSAPLKVASLFSGIGGIELGLRAAGHEVELFVERDACARKVLENQFSGVALHDDVTTLKALPRQIDLLAAGFPCQDISQAGRVGGLAGTRSGLVEHVFRLLKKRPVRWVLLENVAFLLRAKRGRVLHDLLASFEALGYRWAYRVVDSQAFGVPQRRERVFILASQNEDPRPILFNGAITRRSSRWRRPPAIGFYWSEGNGGLGFAENAVPPLKSGSNAGGAIPPAILLPDGDVIKPDIRDAERFQGFTPDWTASARSARERWRLVGNAVTVPVAEWVGRGLGAAPSALEFETTPQEEGRAWPRAAFNVDGVRRGADLSPFPFWRKRPRLENFLRYRGALLSERAIAGFLARARASTLTMPPGFLERLEVHRARMQDAAE